jgi:hypothetical protein
MAATTIVGFIAGVLTTVSFLPQVLKTVRTKSTRDISLGMYLILAIGIVIRKKVLDIARGEGQNASPCVGTQPMRLNGYY